MWWTLAAATIGSLTALLIALLVYPRQKKIDRLFDLHAERRVVYRDFAAATRVLIDRIVSRIGTEPIPEEWVAYNKSHAKLMVSAPDEVVFAATRLGAEITIAGFAVRDESLSSEDRFKKMANVEYRFFQCLVEMRKDSFKDTNVTSELLSDSTADSMMKDRAETTK